MSSHLPIVLTDRARKRFFSSFTVGEESECWEWSGRLNHGGYGKFSIAGRYFVASRVSYAVHNGLHDLGGMLVCHTCDNPRCVNPNHLFLGTSLDNFWDCVKKGRVSSSSRGGDSPSKRPIPKLTEDDVRYIRSEYMLLPAQSIADKFGIHPSAVSSIAHGRSWRHVGGVEHRRKRPRRLTCDDVVNIAERRARGTPVKDIALEYGIGVHVVYGITSGRSWKNVSRVLTKRVDGCKGDTH